MKEIVIYLSLPAILTVIMEMPIIIIGLRKVKCNMQYKLTVFTLINIITNLALNSIGLLLKVTLPVIIVEEIIIVLIEAFTYKKAFIIRLNTALIVSVTANLLSGLIGSYLLSEVTLLWIK